MQDISNHIYTVQDISNHINTTSSTATHPLNNRTVQKMCFTSQMRSIFKKKCFQIFLERKEIRSFSILVAYTCQAMQKKYKKNHYLGGYGHNGKWIQGKKNHDILFLFLNWAKRPKNCWTNSWQMPSPNAQQRAKKSHWKVDLKSSMHI